MFQKARIGNLLDLKDGSTDLEMIKEVRQHYAGAVEQSGKPLTLVGWSSRVRTGG